MNVRKKLLGPGRPTSHWVCLLAKEVKGKRPISLLTMLFRIWSRTRKHVAADWSDAKAGARELAAAGGAALIGG